MKLLKTIYLVRHGTTSYNEQDLLQGRIENSLNCKGRREAELLACRLKSKKFDMVYYSPLKRAVQTTEIINKHHDWPTETVGDFVEIDLGDWEGKEYGKIIEQNKIFYQKWMKNPDLPIPGGESFNQVFTRVKRGVDRILNSIYQKILVVGHASVNRAILGNMLKMNPSAARLFRMRNASLSKLLLFENSSHRYVIVESWNDASHLENSK